MTDTLLALAAIATGIVLGVAASTARAAARGLDSIDGLCTLLLSRTYMIERSLGDLRPLNTHANMLGQVVEARKYEASEWATYVVCAVSWHGSLCLRSIDHPDRSGFWVHHDMVAERVREVAS